jgi:hypothetical protein
MSNNFYWITASGPLVTTVTPGSFVSASLRTNLNSGVSFSIIAGSLPKSVTLTTNNSIGIISGKVIGNVYPTTSTFVVRATSQGFGTSIDNTFSITTEPFKAPIWDPRFDLIGSNVDGTFNNFEYIDRKLTAFLPPDTAYDITYSLSTVSNRLPPGISFSSSGTLSGIINTPITSNLTATNTFNFTVIADNGYSTNSKDFEMTVSYAIAIFQKPAFLINSYLGTYSDQSYEIIPVSAYDPAVSFGSIEYSNTAGELPPDLQLDTNDGVLYGVLTTQTNYLTNYNFDITATKRNKFNDLIPDAASVKTFNIDIIQKNSEIISWVTTATLGTTYVYTPSFFKVAATGTEYYLLYFSVGNDLPAGLTLNSNGEILGIPTSTGTYTITVVANTGTVYDKLSWNAVVTSKIYPETYAVKSFNINVISDSLIYTNIYAKLFLSKNQKLLYQQFIENTDVFDTDLIYRPQDANFGVQSEFKMYMHYGVPEQSLNVYNKDFLDNPLSNDKKLIYVNKVNTITVTDQSGVELYDVVYLNFIDALQGTSILNNIRSKFLAVFNDTKINFNFFPLWQKAGSINQSNFIYGAVLCYANPGKGIQILKNLKNYATTLGHFDILSISLNLDRFIIEYPSDPSKSYYLILP